MNLIRIPKYKKYNDDLKAVRITSVPPKRIIKQRYQPRGGNPTVLPVKIDPYKHASRHVKIKDSLTDWYTKSVEKTQTKPVSRFKKLFKKDEETYRCKLTQWYFKKKAIRALKREHLKELKQLQHLEQWKKHDEELIRKAQMDKLQAEREAEVAKQLYEIEKERARIASNALKTHYPYKVEKRTAQTDDTYQRYYNTDFEKKHDDNSRYYEKYYQKYDDVTPTYTAYQDDIYEEEKPKKNKKEKPIKLRRETPVKFKKEKDDYKIKKAKPVKIKKPKPIKIKKEKPPKMKKEKPPKVKKEKPLKMKGKKYKDSEYTYEEPYYYPKEPMKKEKKRKREKRHKAAKYKEVPVTLLERPRRSLDEKFVNCFYKSCCEFYCCVSVIIIIGLIIIFII